MTSCHPLRMSFSTACPRSVFLHSSPPHATFIFVHEILSIVSVFAVERSFAVVALDTTANISRHLSLQPQQRNVFRLRDARQPFIVAPRGICSKYTKTWRCTHAPQVPQNEQESVHDVFKMALRRVLEGRRGLARGLPAPPRSLQINNNHFPSSSV